MFHNRKRNIMTPTTINNFNKLLCTLDETSKKTSIIQPIEKNILKKEEEMKQFIDEMIKNLSGYCTRKSC